MSRSRVLNATLMSMALVGLKLIIAHELQRSTAQSDVWNDEAWKNLTQAWANSTVFSSPSPLNSTATANMTVLANTTSHATPEPMEAVRPFYSYTLPMKMFFTAFMVPIMYHWHIFLEFCFPARKRPRRAGAAQSSGPPSTQPEKLAVFDEDGNREEEVVKRWIEDGKVRRSGVSVCNTLAKWFLNYTLGVVLRFGLLNLFDATIGRQSLTKLMWRLPAVRVPFAFYQTHPPR